MRLVSYEIEGAWRAGVLSDGAVVDAGAAAHALGVDGDHPAWTPGRTLITAHMKQLMRLGRWRRIGSHSTRSRPVSGESADGRAAGGRG